MTTPTLPPLPAAWQAFQLNPGWSTWENVIPSAIGCHGVVAAFTAEQTQDYATQAIAQAPNAWKEAVLDKLALTCMDASQDQTPAAILDAIIAWHVHVAIDHTQSPIQAVQEPVAYVDRNGFIVECNDALIALGTKLYASPQPPIAQPVQPATPEPVVPTTLNDFAPHQAISTAGTQLSNIAYNWSRREGLVLTTQDCAMLKRCADAWDIAHRGNWRKRI